MLGYGRRSRTVVRVAFGEVGVVGESWVLDGGRERKGSGFGVAAEREEAMERVVEVEPLLELRKAWWAEAGGKREASMLLG